MTDPSRDSAPRGFGRPGDWHPAFVAAAGILALLVVQQVLLGLVDSVEQAGMPGDSILGYLWLGHLQTVLLRSLPLVVGVFFSLWLLVPITANSRLLDIVAGALAAAAIGALLIVVVVVITSVGSALAGVTFFGNSFPDIGGPLRASWMSVISGVAGAGRAFVLHVPIVVLAGLLLRTWLRQRSSSVGGDDTSGEV